MSSNTPERRAGQLLTAFSGAPLEIEPAAWLAFLHGLSNPSWPAGPPAGQSWDELTRSSEPGPRLEQAVDACRARWPLQLGDDLLDPGFAAMPESSLRRAFAATEALSDSMPDQSQEILGMLCMCRSGSSAQRARGEFYTPATVARMISQMMSIEAGEWVLEPACGTGQLLSAAVGEVRGRLGQGALATITWIGVELAALPAAICRLQLLLAGLDEESFWIFTGDALSQAIVGRDPSSGKLREIVFDVIFANPPFGTSYRPPQVSGAALVVPEAVLNRRIRVPRSLRSRLLERGALRLP